MRARKLRGAASATAAAATDWRLRSSPSRRSATASPIRSTTSGSASAM